MSSMSSVSFAPVCSRTHAQLNSFLGSESLNNGVTRSMCVCMQIFTFMLSHDEREREMERDGERETEREAEREERRDGERRDGER